MATGIKYIGKAKDHVDRIYGTNLHFVPGKAYPIEDKVAAKMLLHTDTYARAKTPKGVTPVRAIVESQEELDRRNAPPMLDFHRMDDRALRDFSLQHYNEHLPPHATHQTLVDRVMSFSLRGG